MTAENPSATVPDALFADEAAESRWRSRFTAVRMTLPEPARDEPDHCVYVSNESGVFELVTWDAGSGAAVRATDRPDGTTLGVLSADGRSLWWFDDTEGDEFGSWRYQMFGAAPGSGAEALPAVAAGYPAGVEIGRRLAIAGFSDDDGTRIQLATDGGITTVYRHEADGGLAALSTDETIWVLSHSEHGDSRYPALRAYRVADGAILAELDDSPGKGLTASDFSPVPGDQRLLVGHERRGRDELGIWDIATGEFRELVIDLPGDLDACFYADAAAILIVHHHQGRSTLHRYELAEDRLIRLPVGRGVITGALTRPNGDVWYRQSNAATGWALRVLTAEVARAAYPGSSCPPPATAVPAGSFGGIMDIGYDATGVPDHSAVLIAPAGPGPAASQPLTDLWVDGAGGRIHAFLARPAEPPAGPGPTVFLVHGGPAAADDDSFDALRATYLDAGIAVCQVNYRGSTGYGSAWRDALTARIGHTELADIAAVQDHLIIRGLIDAERCAIAGHSWGGYLALLALGTQSSRWACGVAGVPVADYLAAYADEMEPMRAYDRAIFGGSPEDRPDRYRDSSPLNWVDYVTAPVLVMAGANDPRCPIRQIDNYLAALAARGAEHRVYRFTAGHGSMVVEERMRQAAVEVAFVREHLIG